MGRKIRLVGEKLKMLEVLIFEKADEKSVGEESREKEWMAMKEDVLVLKRKDFEKSNEIVKLKGKIESFERGEREERNEIWAELEEWNSEWEKSKLKEREAAEQRKIERFNRKREEELWEGQLNNMAEGWDLLRRRLGINEEKMGRFIKEASKALIEVKLEVEDLKKKRDDEEENNEDERMEKGVVKLRGKKEDSKETKGIEEKLCIEGASKLAVEWEEVEKDKEKEGEEK